jgi:hypothetical protein
LYVSVNNDWVPVDKLSDTSSAFGIQSEVGFPTVYGSRLRSIFLEDTAGVMRAVFAICYSNNGAVGGVTTKNERIIAIFSGHSAPFQVTTPDNSVTDDEFVSYYPELSSAGSIGIIIKPGLNLRTDNQTTVARSDHAESANISFAINTGELGNPGDTIPSVELYHQNKNIIPELTETFTVGSSSFIFEEGHFKNIVVGNTTEGSILPYSNANVSIGSETQEITSLYVTNIYASGEVIFDQDIGSDTDPVENIYVNNFYANSITIANSYTLPGDAGDPGHILYTDGAGNTTWAAQTSDIADITAGTGIIFSVATTLGAGTAPPARFIDINVSPGTGIDTTDGNVNVDLSPFSTDDLDEGTTNLYFTTARARTSLSGINGVTYTPSSGVISANTSFIRNLFDGDSGISYNPATGVFSYTGTSPFDGLDPLTFVRTTGNQTVGGVKRFTQGIRVDADIIMGGADFQHVGFLTFKGLNGDVNISSDGDLIADGDITAFSDIRLKEDLQEIKGALNRVNRLTGYTYKRIDRPDDRRSTGLIAQDVEKVLPESVHENADGIKSVAYGNMMGLMVEAIKELSAEVEKLKAELRKND